MDFLKGKRTYIVGAVAVALAVVSGMGWLQPTEGQQEIAVGIIGLLTIIFRRLADTKK